MALSRQIPLSPRKKPRQARSAVTVEAIFDATIQVLMSDGASRLTTTRVAERAGVSVGTMYQYFPNKQALLYAVLQRHLGIIADAVEAACRQLHGQPLAAIADGLADAYLAAVRIEASRALYLASSERDVPDVADEMSRRIHAALRSLLASSSDGVFDDLDTITFVVHQTLSGTVRAVLEMERNTASSMLDVLRSQLPILCRAYLSATSRSA